MKEPNGWHQVSLSQFAQIYDIIIDKSIDEFDKDIRVISILIELNVLHIEDLDIKEFVKLKARYKWAFNPEFKASYIDPIYYNGYKLVFTKDIYNSNNFKAGAYITLMSLTEKPENIHHNINSILTNLCVVYKRRKLFGWKKVELTNKELLDLIGKAVPIDMAYSYAVFFCNYAENLTENIKRYLIKKANKNLEKARKLLKSHLKNIGDGLQS